MEKEIKIKFGKKYYLLGKNEEGKKVWLEEASWDCGWYWGLGYIEIFNKNYTDIMSHQHFDGLFLKNSKFIEGFREIIKNTYLIDHDIWQLLENFKSLYILKNYSDFLHIGGAHYTTNKNRDLIKNEEEYDRINKVLIPKILEDIYKMLSPEEEKEQKGGV